MNEDTGKVIEAIVNDIGMIVHEVFADNEISENIKVHKNTLINSNIDKDTIVRLRGENSPVIDIILNSYIEYIERGREGEGWWGVVFKQWQVHSKQVLQSGDNWGWIS